MLREVILFKLTVIICVARGCPKPPVPALGIFMRLSLLCCRGRSHLVEHKVSIGITKGRLKLSLTGKRVALRAKLCLPLDSISTKSLQAMIKEWKDLLLNKCELKLFLRPKELKS